MANWKFSLISAGVLLFVGINTYLIIKEDSKIEKKQLVLNWNDATIGDIKETTNTNGIIEPTEEIPIYFHPERGAFQKFLIKEGDSVSAGTPLFEYTSTNINRDKEMLQSEMSEIEAKIKDMEDHISELEDLVIDVEAEQAANNNSEEEKNHSYLSVHGLEKEILQKELELAFLESELEKYDEQEKLLNEAFGQLTAFSEYDGVVKAVDTSLQNPIITLQTNSFVAKGNVSENQLRTIQEGMEVKVHSGYFNKGLNGQISKIFTTPSTEPSLEKENEYPIIVEIPNEDEALVTGTHVSMSIIINEVSNVIVLPVKNVIYKADKSYAYLLKGNGKIKEQEITTGLSVDGKIEITNGLKAGDLTVSTPSQMRHLKDRMFRTPLKPSKITKEAFEKLTKKEKLNYVLRGFLQR